MKKTLLTVLVAAAMTSTLAQAVVTDYGTLTITGSITEAAARTCKIAVGSEAAVDGATGVNVLLDPVSADELTTAGSTSAPQPFTLKFSACPAAMNSTAQLTLDGTADDDTSLNAFKNMGSATGVAVQIKTIGDKTFMIPGAMNKYAYQVADSAFEVPLAANLVKTSADDVAVTTGDVSVISTIKINYN